MPTIRASETPLQQPRMNPVYRLRWEDREQCWFLLYPEGIVKLNESAGRILEQCDGARTVDEIVEAVEAIFGQTGLAADIQRFLEVAFEKDWIRTEL